MSDDAQGETAERELEAPALRVLLTIGLLAVTAILFLIPPESRPSGGVASATATPAPIETAKRQLQSIASATRNPYPSQLPSPSPVRPDPSASPSASRGMSVTYATVKAWQANGLTRAQVLVALRNDGPTPLEFVPSGSRYRVLSADGAEVTSGVFTYAAPDRVGPGGNAYMIETLSAIFASPAQVARVEVQPATRPTTAPAKLMETRELSWRASPDGLRASGSVVNTTGVVVDSGFVCVLFFDRNGRLVGGAYDLTDVHHLIPGESVRFATSYPGTGPLREVDVARAQAIAQDLAGAPAR